MIGQTSFISAPTASCGTRDNKGLLSLVVRSACCLLSWALEQLANRAQSTQYTLLHGADDLPVTIVEA